MLPLLLWSNMNWIENKYNIRQSGEDGTALASSHHLHSSDFFQNGEGPIYSANSSPPTIWKQYSKLYCWHTLTNSVEGISI